MTKPYTKTNDCGIFYFKDEACTILHRENGPAREYTDGSKEWLIDGKRHREDGPAIEYVSGYKSWFLNGKRHRLDGPAFENSDGIKYWYLDGKEYTEEEHKRLVKMIAFI